MKRLAFPTLVLLALAASGFAEERAVEPPGTGVGLPFTPGILSDDLLFLSGAIANDPGTTNVTGDVAEQTRKTMENLGTVLMAAGLDFDRVVSAHVYLADARHYDAMNEVYGGFFADEKPPARTTVEADVAIPNAEMEVSMIAAREGVELEWIVPEGWPASALYAWGVRAGDTLFLSGMVSFDPGTSQVVGGSVTAQTERTLANVGGVLKAAGMTPRDVVSCSVYLKDARDYAAMNEAYGAFFSSEPPARATVRARLARPELRIEITCMAVRGAERKVVLPEGATPGPRPFSPAIQAGERVYLSGMIGRGSDGTYPAGAGEQTRVVLERLAATLKAAGMDFRHVESATVYLTDVRNYQAMNAVYAEMMPEVPPARATVGTGLMSSEALVEISMIAAPWCKKCGPMETKDASAE